MYTLTLSEKYGVAKYEGREAVSGRKQRRLILVRGRNECQFERFDLTDLIQYHWHEFPFE
jgi:hypothetical protein